MKTIPVSIVITTLAATSQAQPPGPAEMREEPRRPFAEMWKQADQDGNGSLSFGEFSSLPRLQTLEEEKRKRIFERLDKNTNRAIEREEMQHGKPQAGGQEPRHPMRRLWELDTNKDGAVSRDEFLRGELSRKLPPERQAKLFERLDTDGDGKISPQDRPQAPGPFNKERGPKPQGPNGPNPKHRDHSAPEGFHAPLLRPAMLPHFDTDKDGALDFTEFSSIPLLKDLDEDDREGRFEKMDSDHNLKISPEELMPKKPVSPNGRMNESGTAPSSGTSPSRD